MNYYWLERVMKHHSFTEFLLLIYWLIPGTTLPGRAVGEAPLFHWAPVTDTGCEGYWRLFLDEIRNGDSKKDRNSSIMKLLQICLIGYWFCYNRYKITLGTNDLLQPRPEPSAPSLGGLPGDVAEDLHVGGDQGLFFLWEDLLISLLDMPYFK